MLKYVSLFLLLQFLFISQVLSQPSDVGVAAKLYGNGHPVNNSFGEIKGIAGYGNYLYTSFRYYTNLNNESPHEIHTWNISDPTTPQLVSVSQFHGLLEGFDESLNAPKNFKVIKGHLIFWAGNRLYVNRINQDGSLTEVLHTGFEDDLNPEGTGDLSFGGVYASTLRTMLSNNEFLNNQDEARLSDYALINLQDPTAPYLETLNRDVGKDLLFLDNPISGSYRGLPSALKITDDAATLNVNLFESRRAPHFDRFWNEALRSFLVRGNLRKSLGALNTQIVTNLKVPQLSTKLFNQFSRKLRMPADHTLSAVISGNFADGVLLSQMMSDYNIKLKDSGRLALQKIIEKVVHDQFSVEVRKVFGEQLFKSFHDNIFGVEGRTLKASKGALKDIFNAEMKERGVERYLVGNVLSPLVGNPPFLRLKLGDFIKRADQTGFAEVINGALTMFHTLFPVEAIRNGLPFDTPPCFSIPRSVGGLLKQMLINSGPRLDGKGLAFTEMLKLVDFYTGNGKYNKLIAGIANDIKSLHADISSEFIDAVLAPINLQAIGKSKLDDVFAQLAEKVSLEKAISLPLTTELAVTIEAAGIDLDLSVEDIFERVNFYTDPIFAPPGSSIATASSLRAKIQELGLDQVTLQAFLRRAGERGGEGAADVNQIALLGRAVTKHLLTDIFGDQSDESTLQDAFNTLVTGRISGKVFGDFVNRRINGVLEKLEANISLPSVFGIDALDAKGDCIAKYQAALRATELFAANSIVFFDFVPFLEGANLNLTIAYEKGIEAVVRSLLNEFLSQIFTESVKSYESWFSRPSATSLSLQLNQLLATPARYVRPFIFGDKVALIATDAEFYSLGFNNAVRLITFDPLNVDATKHVTELGDWYSVNNVVQEGDFILVQGEKRINDFSAPSSLLVHMRDGLNTPKLIGGDDAEDIRYAANLAAVKGGQYLAMSNVAGEVYLVQSNYN